MYVRLRENYMSTAQFPNMTTYWQTSSFLVFHDHTIVNFTLNCEGDLKEIVVYLKDILS